MKRFVVALLIAGALAGCVAEGETFDTVEAPEWQAGYQYAYQMSGSAEGSAAVKVNGDLVDGEEFSEPIEAQPYLVYEVLTNQATIGGQGVYLAAAQIDDFMELLGGSSNALAIRQADLAPSLASVTGGKLTGELPPGDVKYLDFPLSPGKTWSYALPNNSPDDEMIGDYIINAEATKIGQVTTPAGTFDAIHVVAKASFPDMSELVKQMEDEFRSAGFKDVNIALSVKLHVLTDYAPAVMNVVREQTVVDVDLQVTFKEGSDSYDLRAITRVNMLSELLGAELVSVPDLGQAGAVAALESGRAPIDPTGTITLTGGPVSLSINASESEVNAADPTNVDFTITAAGVPDGMFVAYEVRDAVGKTGASGEGTEFSHTFDEPGIHHIVAKVTDGTGYSVAVATMPIVADYKTTVTAECAQVSTVMGFACTQVAVPLRPGKFTASIEASALSMGQTGVPGTFTYHQFGLTNTQETTDGSATLDLNDFPGDATNGYVTWQPTVAGALEVVTFDVVLDYDAPTVAQASASGTLAKLSPSIQLEDMLSSLGIEL